MRMTRRFAMGRSPWCAEVRRAKQVRFCVTDDFALTCWDRFPVSFDRQNLQPFGPEIWIADAPVASFYGFPYSTRMAVIRLSDGILFVWSPVALSTELRAAVDALGPVRHLVSPNALHHL